MPPAPSLRGGGPPLIGLALYAQLVTSGLTTYSLGVFLLPVADDLGASRMQIASATTWYLLVSSAIAPLIGRWIDTGHPRRVMGIGALWFAAGMVGLSLGRDLLQMWVLVVIGVAVGATMCGSLPASALLVRHFHSGRARALGLASTGTPIGGALLPPLAEMLIEAGGWRLSMAVLGVGTGLTLALLVSLLAPRHPGAATGTATAPARPGPGEGSIIRELFTRPDFWLIGGSIGLIFATNSALLILLPDFASDLGFDSRRGALVVTALALGSFAGKLIYSAFGGRLDPRAPIWIASGVQVLAVATLLTEPAYPLLVAAAAINGLGVGALLPAWSLLVAASFGEERFARSMGFNRWILYALLNGGVLLSAHLRDITPSYGPSWWLLGSGSALALLLALFLRLPARETPPA